MAPEVRGWLVSGGVELVPVVLFYPASRMDAPAEWAITDSSLGEGQVRCDGSEVLLPEASTGDFKVLAVEE